MNNFAVLSHMVSRFVENRQRGCRDYPALRHCTKNVVDSFANLNRMSERGYRMAWGFSRKFLQMLSCLFADGAALLAPLQKARIVGEELFPLAAQTIVDCISEIQG